MIVGPDWVWLHFPKCGGTSAEAMLRKNFGSDPGVTFDKIDPTNVIWHESITARKARVPEFSVEGKRIVIIFRRLPEWMLSRVHYEVSRPPHHVVSREQLISGRFFENAGNENSAEATFRFFNNPEVHTWIRLERMLDDFERFFAKKLEPLEHRLNLNKFDYVRDIRFWFTKKELEELYKSAPSWAATEKAVYGDLIV